MGGYRITSIVQMCVHSEVLLSIYKLRSILLSTGPFIAHLHSLISFPVRTFSKDATHLMEGTVYSRWAAEHYSTLSRGMSILDIGKYGVPVGSAVVRWCSKAGYGIPIAPDVGDHDVLYEKRRMSMADR